MEQRVRADLEKLEALKNPRTGSFRNLNIENDLDEELVEAAVANALGFSKSPSETELNAVATKVDNRYAPMEVQDDSRELNIESEPIISLNSRALLTILPNNKAETVDYENLFLRRFVGTQVTSI